MDTADPRIVRRVLDTLHSEFRRSTAAIDQQTGETTKAQMRVVDACAAIAARANATANTVTDDEALSSSRASEANHLCIRSSETHQRSTTTQSSAQSVATEARIKKNHWSSELSQAKNWLAEARTAHESAQQNLRSAQHILRSAYSDYNACCSWRDDEGNGRNCNAESSSVFHAETEVKQASEMVASAVAEVGRAEAKVNRCRKALEFASRATDVSAQALSCASDAVSSADDAKERAQEAQHKAEESQQAASRERNASNAANTASQAAHDEEKRANGNLSIIRSSNASVQEYGIGGTRFITETISILDEINRATLNI